MAFQEGLSRTPTIDNPFEPRLPSGGLAHDYIVNLFEGESITPEVVARVAPDRLFQYDEANWGFLITPRLAVIRRGSERPFIRSISAPVSIVDRTLRPMDDDGHRSAVDWGDVVTEIPEDYSDQILFEANELAFQMLAPMAYPRTDY